MTSHEAASVETADETPATPPAPPTSSALRLFLRGFLLVSGTLLLPVLPLIVLGLAFEERVEQWLARPMSGDERFGLIVGLLSVDLFLPIPSSAVSTYGGGRIGFLPAASASFLGMTLGSGLGYLLAWRLGESFARRFTGASDWNRLAMLAQRIGPAALIVTRPLPLLAEAGVLLLGALRLPARQFWPALLIGNLLVSSIYSAVGAWFQNSDALPWAIGSSAIVPLLLTWIARWFSARSTRLFE